MATADLTPRAAAVQLDSDALFEIVNGEQREIPHMGALAGTVASLLAHYLNLVGLSQKLGFAVVEVLFRLRAGHPSRRPDVAFVTYARWQAATIPTTDPPEWEVVPDLAVEVVSPSNTAEEIADKIDDYFAAGVQRVWVIYPRQRWVYVYESPTQVRILRGTDELEGDPVLPGFRMSVADLFAALVKPT
jgi:Uma2 family endonuclease